MGYRNSIEASLRQWREIEETIRRHDEGLRSLRREVEAFESTRRTIDALYNPTDHLRHVNEMAWMWEQQRRAIEESSSAASKAIQKLIEDTALEDQRWNELRKLFEPSPGQRAVERILSDHRRFLESRATWQASLADVTGVFENRLASTHAAFLLPRLLAPQNDFSAFARQSITNAFRSDIEAERDPTDAALILAEAEVTESTALVTTTAERLADAEGPPEAHASVPVAPSALALFNTQERELRSHGPVLVVRDATSLIALSPSAGRAEQQRRISRLVIACNDAAEFAGLTTVFKPTTTLLRCIGDLGWIPADSRESFGTFVDCLYLVLYEGAGNDHLRYDGLLPKSEWDVIWAVKHFRNKMLRHDPDHGQEAAIRKSWRDFAKSAGLAGVDQLPVSAREFLEVHDRFAAETITFLEKLLAAIRRARLGSPASHDS